MRRLARDERGSVLVIVALGIPTFILLAALALEFGSWYAHKRLVQNRADAAAFAAGVAYGSLFPDCTNDTALAGKITDAAKQYAGVAPSDFNSSSSDPAPDVTVNPDGPNPCQPHNSLPQGEYASQPGTIWTDVQVKQTVPSLFGGFGFIPTITANARVALMKLQSMTGFRPLAFANPAGTTCAWAQFGDSDPVSLGQPTGPGRWHVENVPVHTGNAGIPVSVITGDCDADAMRVSYPNIGFVGVYDHGGATSAPQLQDLFFSVNGPDCDGVFVSRFANACNMTLSAEFSAFPSYEITRVTADVNGSVPFTGAFDSWQGDVPATQLYGGAGTAPNGTIPITFEVDYIDHTGPSPSDGSVTIAENIPPIMAGNDQQEGPIRDFKLSRVTADKNQNISETIDLTLDVLANAGPPQVLRARSGDADKSLNGVVDCAGNGTSLDSQGFADRMRFGCKSTYQVQVPTACSGAATTPPSCIGGTSTPGAATAAFNALFAPDSNGDGNPDCSDTPNNWPSYPNIPRGDPRLITIPITRIEGPFRGNSSHPVTGFAAFYVSGWEGMPSGCAGSESNAGTRGGLAHASATADLGGEVWGHFIRFVQPSGAGAPQRSDDPTKDVCNPNDPDISACIATLVQ